MRIHILSDLHLEFSPFKIPPTDADVLVLAGDVHTRDRGMAFAAEQARFRPTLYVAGNHEFYGAAIPKLYDKLRNAGSSSPLYFLERSEVILDGVRFLGCTLWTDFGLLGCKSRDLAMNISAVSMNDYRRIRVSPEYRRLTPAVVYSLHRASIVWLERAVAQPFDGPTVVVTHHAPSLRSVAEEDRSDLISASYASDLDSFIEASGIALWIHGHTHLPGCYTIGKTRVVSNPRGYPGESKPGFDPSFVVSL